MSRYNVLKQPHDNLDFEDKGYVVIKGFLSALQVEELKQFFTASGNPDSKTAFTTFASQDLAYKRAADTAIKNTFKEAFQQHITEDYKPFWGNFFTKAGGSPAMPLHADWQYAHEPGQISLNIWVPLVDTNAANGAFGIVPYSHKVVNQPRGTNLTQFYLQHAGDIQQQFGKLLEFSAGDAVIYDHRLFHYSLPNTTTQGRLAATLVTVPANAKLLHYYAESEADTLVYEYEVNSVDDLMPNAVKQKPQHLQPVSSFTFNPRQITPNDVKAVYKQEPNKGIIKKVLEKIGW